MSFTEYKQQLQQVDIALGSCSDESREELLSLKHSLEELIALTCENDSELVESEEKKNDSIDDEYSLFMAEINEVSQSGLSESKNDSHTFDPKEMEGKMCRAPHTNKWGSKGYHNAMICSFIPSNGENEEAQVRVLFVNPTHEEMLPCPFYFESDCKFTDEKCKFSHGEIVSASDIQDYIEPDFASLQIGSPVLAQQKNKLWGRAKISRILDDTCLVQFETVKKDMELPFKEILPMKNDTSGSNKDSDEESSEDADIDQDVVNMSLMNTPSDGPLGDWEKFTKGIGSKLMQKMGYIVGTGLGKRSDGMIDPVTAVVLPPGKSLDHCMNLREQHGGDKNLFSIEKKMKILQRKQELKNRRSYQREQNQKDVFNFLNNTLTNNPSCSTAETYTKSQHRKEIRKESCRNLNVESFKTEENIKKTEKDINIIRESLARHKDANSLMHKNLQQKLNSSLSHLSDLKDKAQNIKNEQDNRRDKKKLTVF